VPQLAAHLPDEQTLPAAHGALQPPQLALSFCVSTQRPLQKALVTPLQVSAQIPDEHTWPLGQVLPHWPQLAGSMAVLAQ
jgi:hypothetical protein